jgi:hypothetical protein
MSDTTLSQADWIRLGIAYGYLPETITVEAAPAVGGGTMAFSTLYHIAPVFVQALRKGVSKSLYDALQSNKKLAAKLGSAYAAQEHFRRQFAGGNWVARRRASDSYGEAARQKFIAELVERMAKADMKRAGLPPSDKNRFLEAQRAILDDRSRMAKIGAAWEAYRAAAEADDDDEEADETAEAA